ncbi:MAG TPA: hypothetical protein VFU02_06010, partial [Polyangiaceae bacterium]|nr:hypothetical protein [Polyangiaceae bacterium]
ASPWVLVVALAWTSIAAVLARTEGAPSVPLDDAYIHFQFARAFANLDPFVYTPGSAPAAGATSLLWPALLAPAFWLGVSDVGIIWWAWLLGFLSLGLTATETYAIADRLVSPLVALAAGLTVLCFGGLTWLAASGMEAVPFAWLWLRTFRRLADWWEAGRGSVLHSRLGRELLILGIATPLMRPEGAVAALCVALAFGFGRARRTKMWAMAPLVGVVLPAFVTRLGAGSFSSTTAEVKWLPNNPYLDATEVAAQVVSNTRLLFGTLFDGEAWSASVVPSGGALFALCALPALAVQTHRRRCYTRGVAVLVAALGIWIPATYDTFLWNRLRYLWPFAPAWFVALGALCDLIGDALERVDPRLRDIRTLLGGALAGAFAAKLSFAIDDVAESAYAIQEQQVSLGRWASRHLPKDAIIGVNDTGAIAYFSGRRTFDIVGLTTPHEAKHWVAGAGSRFEHYEQLPRGALPTHFIVYPEWFALDPLLGDYLTERHVNASILGGTTMVARVADYSLLNSAQRPVLVDVRGRRSIDRLDVADLASERSHDYQLFGAVQSENALHRHGGWADGGRARRTLERFRFEVEPAGSLVARFDAALAGAAHVWVDDIPAGHVSLKVGWHEYELSLPRSIRPGRREVRVELPRGNVASLHFWSYAAASSARAGT